MGKTNRHLLKNLRFIEGEDGGAGASDEGSQEGQDNDDSQEENVADVTRFKETINKKNSEARNLRAQLKEYEAKAKQWDEHEESQKTEIQKIQDEHEKVLARNAELENGVIRERLGRKFNLDDDLLDLIPNGDEETMEAKAKLLSERLKKGGGPLDSSQGHGDDTEENSRDAMARSVFGI